MAPEVIALGEPLLEFNATMAGPLSEVRTYEVGWGGDTSNFSIAASRLGAHTGYLTRLGSDDFGRSFLDLWEAEGIDTSRVIVEEDGATGIYFVSRMSGQHAFTYYRKDSAASHLSPDDIPEGYISGARVFHTSGITQAISTPACDAAFHAIDAARGAGVLVSYDPNVRLKLWSRQRARGIIMETVGLADFIFPSLEDAQFLSLSTEPEDIARDLLARGPQVVVVKLGENGALLATHDGLTHLPPYPVRTVDSTGAGDTFDGAFIAAYLKGYTFEECARFANIAAALATTGLGAVAPIPRLDQVEKIYLPGDSGRGRP